MRKDRNEFRDGWRVILASSLGVGIGITGAPFFTLGIFIGPLSERFGWSRAELSAAALCLHSYVVTSPFVGPLIDRIGARKLALTALAGLVIGFCLLTQMGPGVFSFYALLLIFALLGCGTTPIVWSYAVNTWFQKNRGLALSLTLVGTGIASTVAPVAVNALIAAHGWQAGYLGLAAFAALVVIPVAWMFFREKPTQAVSVAEAAHDTRRSGFSLGEAVGGLRFWQLLLGIGCVSLGTGCLIVHLVPLLTDAGLSRNVAARIAGLMGFAIIAGRLSVGVFVDRIHGPYVAAVYLLFPVLGCVVLALSTITAGVAMAAVVMIGLAAGAEVDLIAFLISRYFGLKAYGAIYGWLLVPFGLGAGLGPLLSGWMYDRHGNYMPTLYGAALVFVSGAALIGTLGRYPVFAASRENRVA
jgi:MFS family permease